MNNSDWRIVHHTLNNWDFLSAGDVADWLSIPRRKVLLYVEQGIIEPKVVSPGTGRERKYTLTDLELFMVFSRLDKLGVAYEVKVVSAHRTPDLLFDYAKSAQERGLKVIIAGAGGAAHLPGMCASQTSLPVLGVPVKSRALSGLDSLLSIVQMPGGVAVGTLAIGDAGAKNAGLLAAQILATADDALMSKIDEFRQTQTDTVLSEPDPRTAL